MKKNKSIVYFAGLFLSLLMLHACDKDKMEWGRDPMYGEVTEAELPLQLKEAISRYDALNTYSDFPLGVGIDYALYANNSTYQDLVNANFDEITFTNEMKHRFMVKSSGEIDFSKVDGAMSQISGTNLNVYGHTLVWHANQNASYLNSLIAPTVIPGSGGGSLLSVSALKDGSFSGWSQNNEPGISIAEGEGLEGGDAIKFEVTDAGNEWDTQLIGPDISATEGHEYEISFWIRSDDSGEGRMSFVGMSNNYPWVNGAGMFSTSGTWTKVTYGTSTIGDPFEAVESSIKIAFDLGKTPGVYYVDLGTLSVVDSDADPQEYNYVSNGSFETGALDDWLIQNEGDGITVTDEEHFDGEYALKMVTSSSSGNAWDIQLQSSEMNLMEGGDYTFSFLIKSDSPGEGRISFPGLSNEYPWMDWKGAGASESFTTSTDWNLIQVDLNDLEYASGASALKLSFDLGYLPGVTYYVDAIKIVDKGGSSGGGGEPVIIEMSDEEKEAVITSAMESWITEMVSHYEGRVIGWDVVNEALNGNGGLRTGSQVSEKADDDFYWQDYMGKDYAVKAFQWARAADPAAKLFINDYNLEESDAKLEGLIEYVNYIEDRGATVDGIGTQMHVSINSDKDMIESMFDKLGKTGKLIKITELDVKVETNSPSSEEYAQQAEMYHFIIEKYKEHIPIGQQFGVTVWGLSDNENEHEYWLPDDAPNLWDAKYERKHAYKLYADALAGKDISADFSGELQY